MPLRSCPCPSCARPCGLLLPWCVLRQLLWCVFDRVCAPALWVAAGIRFIFGLNFLSMNVSLAVHQMDAILEHLPREAILAFEVGNEVSQGFKERLQGIPCNCHFTWRLLHMQQ